MNIKKFIPKIGSTNEQARVTWLEKTIKNIPNNSTILDAGAGERQFKKFCNHLKYTSQDFGEYDGIGDRVGLQQEVWDNSKLDIISDIIKIPVPNESYDSILCVEVFEHIPDPIAAIKEFSRILKKGGTLILTAPFCSYTHFSPYHYYSGFNLNFYKSNLSKYGFSIKEISTNGNFFDYLAQEIRMLPEISKKYSFTKLNIINKALLFMMLKLLQKLNKKGNKSNELLCFGYHVIAVKN